MNSWYANCLSHTIRAIIQKQKLASIRNQLVFVVTDRINQWLVILGVEYKAMTIKDNIDAKDDGTQVKLFLEAADVINDMMKKV